MRQGVFILPCSVHSLQTETPGSQGQFKKYDEREQKSSNTKNENSPKRVNLGQELIDWEKTAHDHS